mmetsp:Transcript_34498/g.62167  ORF Transcript_34498/g.62167 Transcript_34498/m.62167 type:complete len:342 (-) Transcript_34498:269-1294(-)|eukprot:CAMPEP_0175081472 /NCGR_PEP_ID=MMETSP0052_2-20121109/26169_1 /TAXON_ID=51329 ORGANISM="Polytomella parva, Strain SAG 63-3" /NCGR_SAMPLE_ID=MMETSP0052_2 /ASSEMBLY_ACC=CAM_ASM_000194 /LENGTH=341 /DNA_ID=CAMNT_0016352461 /DNA_START=61 /DNA_END=1086 /DNA_ORIENTATION=-
MLAAKGSSDAKKGASVRNQQILYEKNLESRILLQKCLEASNALPRPDAYITLTENFPEVKEGYEDLRQIASETHSQLMELQSFLLRRNPILSQALDEQAPAIQKAIAATSSASDAVWIKMSGQNAIFAKYRDASIDRWHSRTLLSSGSSLLKNSLRVLNQSVSSQVSTLMQDPEKIVKRSRVLVSECPRVLCAPVSSGASSESAAKRRRLLSEAEGLLDEKRAGEDEKAEEPEDDGSERKGEDRDMETFDDGEFYKQLLKDFLDKSLSGAGNAGALAPVKRRKLVDRRASKGRRIRYHVHEKLVGFATPIEKAIPPFAQQLLSNLFGANGGGDKKVSPVSA